MKKLTFIIFICMFFTEIHAQNNAAGIKNTIIFSLPQEQGAEMYVGVGTSLTYRRAFSGKTGIIIEPGFINTGKSVFSYSGHQNRLEQTRDNYIYRYLEVPVLFSYLAHSNNFFLDFHTGLSPMLLLKATYTRLGMDVSSHLKPYTLNYLTGISLKFFQERVDWGITVRYAWNINRTYKVSDYKINAFILSGSVSFLF